MSDGTCSEESEDFVDAVDDVQTTPVTINITDFENEPFPLHRAVFENRPLHFLTELLSSITKRNKSMDIADIVGQKDLHGNTPLHLAVMFGHRDHINFLLQQNAPIKTKNIQGWTPLDEAISYGDRKIIKSILLLGRKQARQSLGNRSPKLMETLRAIKDFQMELRWEFHSWIPLLKRFLPSDVCAIAKRGCSFRLDTTLLDFNDRRWRRGNLTFLFIGNNVGKKSSSSNTAADRHSLVIMDNELKVYQYIRYNEEMDIDEDVDMLMSTDLVYLQPNTKAISFSRAQSGWFFNRYNKTEKVGQFDADFYNINGFMIETKKRREHLSEEDIYANKAIYETLKKSLEQQKNHRKSSQKSLEESSSSFDDIAQIDQPSKFNNTQQLSTNNGGNNHINGDTSHETNADDHHSGGDGGEETDDEENLIEAAMVSAMSGQDDQLPIKPRRSLPPPTQTNVTWEQYINAPKGMPPCLGRQWDLKVRTKNLKATIAMSQEFPLSIESLLNILEVFATFKHFKKLKEFINLNLPPGFPVKIDIPMIATILARVTFLNFNYNDKLDANMFEIPADYTEDPNRFPDL